MVLIVSAPLHFQDSATPVEVDDKVWVRWFVRIRGWAEYFVLVN